MYTKQSIVLTIFLTLLLELLKQAALMEFKVKLKPQKAFWVGLEFPHVFVIGLADGLFPNKRAIDGESDLEEERRLFYVATTRAERSLHLVFPMLSNQKGTPVRLVQSRFLKELPESQYELHNAHSSYRQRRTGWNNFRQKGRGYGRAF